MEKFQEPSALLVESDIISKEEKEAIISAIDRDFRSHFDIRENLHPFDAASRGILFPSMTGVLTLLLTIVLLIAVTGFINGDRPQTGIRNENEYSEPEWKILKIYEEESRKSLQDKNREILVYRDQIGVYDRKLASIRRLIDIKRHIESRLVNERQRLSGQNLNEKEINSRLETFENDLKADMDDDMMGNYDKNISELNMQIDELLNNKTESELKLSESMDDLKELAQKNDDIRNKMKLNASGLSEDSDAARALESLDRFNESQNKSQAYSLYTDQVFDTILNHLFGAEYEMARETISGLKTSLQNPPAAAISEEAAVRKTGRDLKTLDYLGQVTYTIPFLQGGTHETETGISRVLRQMEIQSDIVINNPDNAHSETAESELRSLISEVPEISRAFAVINESDINKALLSRATGIAENSKSRMIGSITKVLFNKLEINPLEGVTLAMGETFSIYNNDNPDSPGKIGEGVVIGVSENQILGRMDALLDIHRIPEIHDLIYKEP